MDPFLFLNLINLGVVAFIGRQVYMRSNHDSDDDTEETADSAEPAGAGGESLTAGVTDSGNSDSDILSIAAERLLTETEDDETIGIDDPISVDAADGLGVIDLYDASAVISASDVLAQSLGQSTMDGGSGNARIDELAEESTILGDQGNDPSVDTDDRTLGDAGSGTEWTDTGSLAALTTTVANSDGADGNDAGIDEAVDDSCAVTDGSGIDFFDIRATVLAISERNDGSPVTEGSESNASELTLDDSVEPETELIEANVSATHGDDLIAIKSTPSAPGRSLDGILVEAIKESLALEVAGGS